MKTTKTIQTTTFKYDDDGNISEQKIVEEYEIPEFDPIELDDGVTFDTEATIEEETTPLDIIFGIAGVLSIIATSISIVKALRK